MRFTGLIFFLLSFCVLGCSTLSSFDTNTPEGAFKQAEEYEKFERYEEAVDRFKSVKNKFPYSAYAKLSDLKVADIHYKREAYIEAQASYQLYKDFYPDDKQIDYVIFRIGLSYLKQLPETVGRDLTGAEDSIRVFDELIRTHPESKYINEAKTMKRKALKMLAEKELYVADYYFKRKQYKSASGRYEYMLNEYSNVGYNKRALYGVAISSLRDNNLARAQEYSDKLSTLFKNSKESLRMIRELKK